MCIIYGNYKTLLPIPDRHQQDTCKNTLPQGVLYKFRKTKLVKGIPKIPGQTYLISVIIVYNVINVYLIHERWGFLAFEALRNVHKWGAVSQPHNPQSVGSSVVTHHQLLILYVRSNHPYLKAISSTVNLIKGHAIWIRTETYREVFWTQ
jgi:hypothetical protein